MACMLVQDLTALLGRLQVSQVRRRVPEVCLVESLAGLSAPEAVSPAQSIEVVDDHLPERGNAPHYASIAVVRGLRETVRLGEILREPWFVRSSVHMLYRDEDAGSRRTTPSRGSGLGEYISPGGTICQEKPYPTRQRPVDQ